MSLEQRVDFHLRRASKLFRQNKLSEAMDEYRSGIVSFSNLRRSLFSRILKPIEYALLDGHDIFEASRIYLRHFDIESLLNAWEKFASGNKSIDSLFGRAITASIVERDDVPQALLENVKPPKKDSLVDYEYHCWNEAFQECFRQENPNFERIGDYEVYKIGLNTFSRSLLVLKMHPSMDVLKSEADNLIFLKSRISRKNKTMRQFDVAKPIYIYNLGEKHALIELQARGIPLYEAAKDDITALSDAFAYLGLIHSTMHLTEVNYDYVQAFDKVSVCHPEFRHLIQPVLQVLPIRLLYVFDKDAHAGNWFVTDDGIFVLDMPKRPDIPPERDLTKLCHRHNLFPRTPTGDALKASLIANNYVPFFNSECSSLNLDHEMISNIADEYLFKTFKEIRRFISLDCKIIDSNWMVFKTLSAAPAAALSLWFQSLDRPQLREDAFNFIENAVHALDVVDSSYSKYIEFKPGDLSNARSALISARDAIR